METFQLTLHWGTSRGRDTYGYNICSLEDTRTGKRYRCNGGGYDMTGTVVADWLCSNYQDRLGPLAAKRAASQYIAPGVRAPEPPNALYGLVYYTEEWPKEILRGTASLDGVCGLQSVENVARAIGIRLQHTVNRKGHCTGFIVHDDGGSQS